MEIGNHKIRKKNFGLWSVFIRYLLALLGSSIGLIIIFAALFLAGLNSGIILPANQAEKQLAENKQAIIDSQPFDESLIPFYCKYGLFDRSGEYISGSFSEGTIADAKLFLQKNSRYRNYYIKIERKNEICVVLYEIRTHFASPYLDKIFPNIEMTMIGLFIICLFLLVVGIALVFAKRLRMELRPLMEAAEKIKEQDLKFQVKDSRIKEFNEVGQSINEMKEALSNSLKKEWETEQRRKRHISALAHDIKTPLTVIKGNAELMLEEPLSKQCREYADSINKKADTIEEYVRLLIETVKGQNDDNIMLRKVQAKDWIVDVLACAKELCDMQKVTVDSTVTNVPERILVEPESLSRAVLNMVRNSLEHAGGSSIQISFKGDKDGWQIEVADFGKGFSEEALKYADQPFYTQDRERSGKHYGLGLYMVKMTAESHGGKLMYGNKQHSSGAFVRIQLPIVKQD